MTSSDRKYHIYLNRIANLYLVKKLKTFFSLRNILVYFILAIICCIALHLILLNTRSKKYLIDLTHLNSKTLGYEFENITLDDIEKRMQENMPHLIKLVHSAPDSKRSYAEKILLTWQTQLGYKSELSINIKPCSIWDNLCLAQRSIVLGKIDEATEILMPLRRSASPDKSWSQTFWYTLMNLDRLRGDRNQGWIDLIEYKTLFKEKAKTEIEQIIYSI